jgi:hypothetical protein
MNKEGLEYFVGKVCTIFTIPTNRDFKSENPQTFPQPIFHYFVGKVLGIDNKGMFIEQWNSAKKLRTFFFLNHIVSISEEEILDPSNPNDMKIIQDYKKVNEESVKKVKDGAEQLKKQKEELSKNPFIDIESLSKLTEAN